MILDRILAQERKLQFSVVGEELALTGKKGGPSRPKAKHKKGKTAPVRSAKARNKLGKKGERNSPLRWGGVVCS